MSLSGQAIDAVTSGEVKRVLRQRGFKKDGRTFRRQVGGHWLIVNIQASQGNTWDEARFYVNLAVYYPVLGVERGWPVPEKPREIHGQFRRRLEPEGAGWWTLTPASDVQSVSAEVAELLLSSGLPWLEQTAKQKEPPQSTE
ncbi:DUF4304 domain-containing protein [Deinococcus fonticola]|uniref:DUF4304 domain-containing protein n=1 Tax=Deinococcus fonticola TaxID=2528713 RepID=UPI0014315A42|nr:DUF4304 domain-containing protein [Deinococcus fonticola]